jgi:hypothetical protein
MVCEKRQCGSLRRFASGQFARVGALRTKTTLRGTSVTTSAGRSQTARCSRISAEGYRSFRSRGSIQLASNEWSAQREAPA